MLFANWSYPTNIALGAGRLSELGDFVSACGMRKPLLVTDRGLVGLPMVVSVLSVLRSVDSGVGVFSDIASNPDEVNLASGVEFFNAGGYDGVVALGGGSALDLGKLIALMAKQSLSVWDLEDVGDYWRRADCAKIFSIIAVPTTSGTGSEVGRAGVLTDSEKRVKKIIFHPLLLPRQVILDPELVVGLPSFLTSGTGIDAFAHCLEAYFSPHFHPLSHGIGLEGLRLVKEHLPRAFSDGSDLSARAHMMVAALMGATAFQKGLGAIHAVSHPIGAIYGTHHGTTNAAVMLAVLRFNRDYISDKVGLLSSYLGCGVGFDGFYRFVEDFLDLLCLPKSLSDLGVPRENFDELGIKVLSDPSCGGNPRPLDLDNVHALLSDCF